MFYKTCGREDVSRVCAQLFVEAHTSDPDTREADTGRSWEPEASLIDKPGLGQPGLHRDFILSISYICIYVFL